MGINVGELRLTRPESAILRRLYELGESFGVTIVSVSSGELSRGTVYVWLDRLEDMGLVSSRKAWRPHGSPGLPRRLYWLTDLGREAMENVSRIESKEG